MANEPFYHQAMLDTFKREIGYEQIINNLPKDKIVLVDWNNVLTKFKDTQGTLWRLSMPSVFATRDSGQMNANIKSDGSEMNIEVHSLNKGRKAAINFALQNAATTSMTYINSRAYKDCFSDFCLVPRDSDFVIPRIRFVYGNIYIRLNELNDKDVLPVARYLQSAMEKAVAANPEQRLPARPKITYAVTPTQIKVGETFTVTLPTDYPNAQWDFDFSEELLTPNVAYDKKRMNIITLKAVSPGKGVVSFSLMDKKTLWVFTDTVTVNIDPAK